MQRVFQYARGGRINSKYMGNMKAIQMQAKNEMSSNLYEIFIKLKSIIFISYKKYRDWLINYYEIHKFFLIIFI